MVVSAKPSLITLSSNLLYCICLQCVYHARFFSDLTPKINRRHSIINLFLHCPNSQKPKEIVSFDKCISINVLCLGIKKQTNTRIAHCGRFLICLHHIYCLSRSLLNAQTSLHVRLWAHSAAGPSPLSKGLCFFYAGNSQL